MYHCLTPFPNIFISEAGSRNCAAREYARLSSDWCVRMRLFVTDVNILDIVLEAIWDPLDDSVVLIALSAVYWIYCVFEPNRTYACPTTLR
jgi:hypothetical protein